MSLVRRKLIKAINILFQKNTDSEADNKKPDLMRQTLNNYNCQ